ncbi:hypothetical protein J4730_27355 [Klebsiella pneumoniae]|uniref:Cellulose synthase (UDP-forming) n=3 Tax=Klebsiella pneumoniae TaxID=573 RepID=A0A939NL87_KLEPN|nr:hypothetical protein [Klebsiella pneumoniae]
MPDPLFRRESGMIRLSTLLLAPPVGSGYDDYRQHGASWLSASLGCLWASLVWALMPLETPRWQAILARHETYFPHINPHRPRPLDPLRYLLQSLWLLTTRVPEPEKRSTGVRWRRWKGCTVAIRSGWKNCLSR